MRSRTLILFLFAILLAGGTAMLVRSWLAQRTAEAEAAPLARAAAPQKSVLVARGAIARGQILKPGDFAWQVWPEGGIDPAYIQAGTKPFEAFAGWVARDPVGKGEPITEAKIVSPGSRGFLAAVLRQGMRAVSVPVTATSGISGFVFPGDQVDILVSETLQVKGGKGSEGQYKATETVLHDVRVIAVDQKLDSKNGEAVVAHNVTLEVTPKQSEIIAVATEMGKLSLSLRSLVASPVEVSTADSSSGVGSGTFTLDSEVSQLLPKPFSQKDNSGADVVTVLRGNGANRVSVNQVATRVSRFMMRFLSLFGLAGSMTFLVSAIPLEAAEPVSPTADARGIVAVPPPNSARQLGGGDASQIPARGAPIVLEAGKGTLIRLGQAAATVFIANPDVADVQVKSPSLIYITAKSPGETVIYAVDASDSVLLNSPVRVEHGLSRLRSSLRQLAPGERISAESIDGNLVLSGVVSDAGRAEKARVLAASVVGDAKGAQVINRMTVATPNQVSLQVRIAEVSVKVLSEIGVNWRKMGSTLSFQTRNPVTIGAELTNFITIGRQTGEAVSAMIDALAQEGFVTVLAEPNLTAMNGQTASFLVGGEFPAPVASTTASTGGAPTITIEFKQFGVHLAFTPTIIDANHLNLRVRPEVSQLDFANAVEENGFRIPALTVRRAESSVDLGSGESFALAGLLEHVTDQEISKVPLLGDIPIIGAAFRSNRFQRNETELVIIVTPYLVNPVATRLAAPTDGLALPSDPQQVLFSATYRQGLPAPGRGPLNAGGRGLIGPGGFRLD
jgi:pilus assembly protein CpaC